MLESAFSKAGLSKREADVAAMVAKGLASKEVAAKLFVTEKTVKFHLTNIYKKMNFKSRSQLIVWSIPHHTFVETNVQQPVIEIAPETDSGLPTGNPDYVLTP